VIDNANLAAALAFSHRVRAVLMNRHRRQSHSPAAFLVIAPHQLLEPHFRDGDAVSPRADKLPTRERQSEHEIIMLADSRAKARVTTFRNAGAEILWFGHQHRRFRRLLRELQMVVSNNIDGRIAQREHRIQSLTEELTDTLGWLALGTHERLRWRYGRVGCLG
jgi:hypothetical protein